MDRSSPGEPALISHAEFAARRARLAALAAAGLDALVVWTRGGTTWEEDVLVTATGAEILPVDRRRSV